ncbi:polysaccharide deacetylase family protein [Duganella callida]|uniref:NodB homology domain-containing protein n=1 Tax=Duganella callida TaxID=2561932 RepID=A0A4Y9SC95_9BURK|nr:polysaccharide deacetylase family protein [Duganella callida]TFW17288.1 hypothetical protein E4L98_21195 [Duganella callida]
MNLKRLVLHAMKFCGLFALGRVMTRDAHRILCYHGGSIGDEHLFNPKLFCTTHHLARRLDWLQRKGFVPSSLDAIVTPPGTRVAGIPVTITLDDGWYSSGARLIPLMQQYRHTPVLYLVTKMFSEGVPVADVSLRYAVWKAPVAPVHLQGFSSELDGDYDLRTADGKRRLADAGDRWLKASAPAPAQLPAEIERFAAAIGVPRKQLDLASRRFHLMRPEELMAVREYGMAVESHGHAHCYQPGDAVRNAADIALCHDHVLALGLPAPRHYCYPSGEYDGAAHETLRRAGLSSATTCKPGLVRTVDERSRYYLPRFLDGGDVAMIEFEAEMSGVLEWLRALRRRGARATAPAPAIA